MKAIQKFTPEYLERCRAMSPEQIVRFLDDFRKLHGSPTEARSRLISIKIPETLLSAFRSKAELAGTRYQTQIKQLMREWLVKS